MRLIDADTFTEECRKKLNMKALYSPLCIKELVVDEMPTVEAFPLEWLINKYTYATEDILKDWEIYLKEQAERKEE